VFANSGRARIAYDVTGGGEGADVLLIHAGVNDRRSWRRVIARLGSRYRCLAFDMRRYGETMYEREDGWSTVTDALAVLDAEGMARPVVVGCSAGGEAAIDLALAHPGRVAGLCLIGTAVRGAPYPEVTEGREGALTAQLEATEDYDEANRLIAWLWLDGPRADEGRVKGAARELFLEMNDRAMHAPDPGAEAELPDAWPRLGEIAVPTLALVGRLDAERITAINPPLAELIPGARLQWLEGVAHVPHLEGDPATLDAIERFVAEPGS
jgi:pimeloyl-ACP methyl ester carboxylesterase